VAAGRGPRCGSFDIIDRLDSTGSLEHSRRIRLAKVPQSDAIVEQPINLFQCLALAFWYAKVGKDQREKRNCAEYKPYLTTQAYFIRENQVWD
jgi:hypothetical protein